MSEKQCCESVPLAPIGVVPAQGVDLDVCGAGVSFACAIHCAFMPMLISLSPAIGLSFFAHAATEWALILFCISLGGLSLYSGYRLHRSIRAVSMLSIGVGLLVLGRVLEERGVSHWGLIVVVSGGLFVAASHLLNRRLCQSCRDCAVTPHA